MATLDPQTPAPGYWRRWNRQAAQLVLRTPDGLLVLFVGALPIGIISLAAIDLLVGIGMHSRIAQFLIDVASYGFVLPAALLFIRSLFRADGREPPDSDTLWRVFIHQLRYGLMVLAIIASIWLTILMPGLLAGTATPSEYTGTGWLAWLIAGQFAYGQVALVLIWQGVLHLPLAIGLTLGPAEAGILDRKVSRKFPLIHAGLFLHTMVFGVLMVGFPAFGIFAFAHLLAVLYVAAREIGGGIGENGRQQSQEAARTAFAG